MICILHQTLQSKSKAKQRCVMGVGMCLYAQLVQTKNTQCKSAIIIQCYHPYLSGFCSRPRLTQPYISWCCQNLSSLLLKVSVVTADITISGKQAKRRELQFFSTRNAFITIILSSRVILPTKMYQRGCYSTVLFL